MDFPKFHDIILTCLQVPDYARSEFFVLKQKESGWSKGIYLTGLQNEISSLLETFDLRKNTQGLNQNDDGSINHQTDNPPDTIDFNNARPSKPEYNARLTKNVLQAISRSVQDAWSWGMPDRKYTWMDILNYAESGLLFTLDKFQEQLNESPIVFRSFNTKYVLYQYQFLTTAPIFNFNVYRNHIRTLLLNARHPDQLTTILTPVSRLAREIVNLWNSKLFDLARVDSDVPKDEVSREVLRITFDKETGTFSQRINESKADLFKDPIKGLTNERLAIFAGNLLNLLVDEVKIGTEKVTVDSTESKVETFEQLFNDADLIKPCIEVLSKLDKPAVTKDLKTLIGNKGVIVIWLQELKERNFIKQLPNRDYIRLLSSHFNGYKVDAAMFSENRIMKGAERSRSTIKVLFKQLEK